jgi:hypothetical protein
MEKRKPIIILSIIIGMMFYSTTNAETCIWSGGISTDWSDSDNWLDGVVPGPTDDVVFDWNALNDCVLDITTSIGGLTIDNFDYLLTIPLGKTLSITGNLYVGITYQNWDNNADIVLNGNSNQTIEIRNSDLWNFYNLFIDKTLGSIILNSDLYVSGSFANINDTYIDDQGFTIYYPGLPITLLSFGLVKQPYSIKILWTTASELNNNYFVIEKSHDCENWFQIAKINSQGNSSSLVDYSFVDTNPHHGINYYRLTQVDFDGRSETFPLESINYFTENIVIYPNPVKYELSISAEKPYKIEILNQYGVIVLDGNTAKFNVENLTNGIYYIRINNEIYSFIKL